jgi:hypothetical protein
LATHPRIKTLYLDTNIYNRPFDDQSQVRVRLETIAIFAIFHHIKRGDFRLFWSFMIDFENSLNPYQDNRLEISMMSSIAGCWIGPDERIRENAKRYEKAGIKPRDALHLACAVHAEADVFITCDDKLAKRAKLMRLPMKLYNPVDFAYDMEVQRL